MRNSAEAVVDVLRDAKVALDPGLSSSQIDFLEDRFSIRFSPDHARFLSLAVPRGSGWVDWLGEPAEVNARLAAPVEGVLFDVRHSDFWPEEWGDRPGDIFTTLRVAREHLLATPKLAPLYAHRYLPAAPAFSGAPVLSVHQTDVVCYGSSLLAYVQREFLGIPDEERPSHHVEFWSDLAEGRWL